MQIINIPRLVAGLAVIALGIGLWLFWPRTPDIDAARNSRKWAEPMRQSEKSGSRREESYRSEEPSPEGLGGSGQCSTESLREISRRVVLQIDRSINAIDRVLDNAN